VWCTDDHHKLALGLGLGLGLGLPVVFIAVLLLGIAIHMRHKERKGKTELPVSKARSTSKVASIIANFRRHWLQGQRSSSNATHGAQPVVTADSAQAASAAPLTGTADTEAGQSLNVAPHATMPTAATNTV